jgi:hypothetical protein
MTHLNILCTERAGERGCCLAGNEKKGSRMRRKYFTRKEQKSFLFHATLLLFDDNLRIQRLGTDRAYIPVGGLVEVWFTHLPAIRTTDNEWFVGFRFRHWFPPNGRVRDCAANLQVRCAKSNRNQSGRNRYTGSCTGSTRNGEIRRDRHLPLCGQEIFQRRARLQ